MNKTEIKKKNFQTLFIGLEKASKIKVVPHKFTFAVARTISLNKTLKEDIDKTINPSEDYNSYKESLKKLVLEFGKKDGKGDIKIIDNPYPDYELENKEGFEKAKKALKKKHKDDIADWDNRRLQRPTVLEEMTECTLFMVPGSDLPETINFDCLSKILPIVQLDETIKVDTEVEVSDCLGVEMLLQPFDQITDRPFIEKLSVNMKQMMDFAEKVRTNHSDLFTRYAEYEQKRVLLSESSSYRNLLDDVQSFQNPKTGGYEYAIKDQAKFQLEFKKLQNEYDDCITGLENLSKEKITIPLVKIKMEEFPENNPNVSSDMLVNILFMIDDSEEETKENK